MDVSAYLDALTGLEAIMRLPVSQARARRAAEKAHRMLQELRAENDYMRDLTAEDRKCRNG